MSLPTNKGLYITPIRQYLTVNAGQPKRASFTIANYTNQPLTINISAENFSVSNFSYNYLFRQPEQSWIIFSKNEIKLKPNDNQVIDYQLNAPVKAAPGGYYYTIFATAKPSTNAPEIQAATVMYITVNGKLIKTSELENASINHFSITRQIPFWLNIKNTGNVHYITYLSANLKGWFGQSSAVSDSHLLLPRTTRHLSDSIAAPAIPGIYKATYGYRTETGQQFFRKESVAYLPVWFFIVLLLVTWGSWHIIKWVKSKGS